MRINVVDLESPSTETGTIRVKAVSINSPEISKGLKKIGSVPKVNRDPNLRRLIEKTARSVGIIDPGFAEIDEKDELEVRGSGNSGVVASTIFSNNETVNGTGKVIDVDSAKMVCAEEDVTNEVLGLRSKRFWNKACTSKCTRRNYKQ